MKAVVIGSSAGGLSILMKILSTLPASYPYPLFITQHIPKDMSYEYVERLNASSNIQVRVANHNDLIEGGSAYFAPANYHLLIESRGRMALSDGEKVSYCRPSIDVLFESAAEIFHSELLGVILSGANHDGVNGSKRILSFGGDVITQNPETASLSIMPKAVVDSLNLIDNKCLIPSEIITYINNW